MADTGWTVETLKEHVDAIFTEERLRNEQRFGAQQHAVELALDRVDKEFHEHLQQVRDENRLALQASEKAILKAESATEHRFEGVNEFRAQLADQAATLISRPEYEAKQAALADRLDTLAALVGSLSSRLDLMGGHTQGARENTQSRQASSGLLATVAAVVVAAIAIATSVAIAVLAK